MFDQLRMVAARLSGLLFNAKTAFIVVNVAVNLLFLVRSYIAMRVLDYSALGQLVLLQTIVLLLGVLQLGVINGGYRLACEHGRAHEVSINEFVYLWFLLIAGVSIVVAIPVALSFDDPTLAFVLLIGVGAGIATLVRTWVNNQLIAGADLALLNRVNLTSAALSLGALAFVGSHPLAACIASIAIQPLVFIVHAFIARPVLTPRRVRWSAPLSRRIFAAGFVVYLTGIFLLVNTQIERWAIASSLGVDALGHFYVALLFLTLYVLVPTSLDAIFLPRLVQAHIAGRHAEMRTDLRRFLLATGVYATAATAAVILLARPIVGVLLPQYLDDLRYVYLVLPGVALCGLASPLAIVFNVPPDYRHYFIAYGAGTLATAALVGGSIGFGHFDLTNLSIIKTVVFLLTGALIVVGYFRVCARHPEFRLRASPTTP